VSVRHVAVMHAKHFESVPRSGRPSDGGEMVVDSWLPALNGI